MPVENAAYTPSPSGRSHRPGTSFKRAFGLAAEWRIISLAIDFLIACVLSLWTGKVALAFGGLGAASLIRFLANALWLKHRATK